MKIASYSLNTKTSHEQSVQNSVSQSMRIWADTTSSQGDVRSGAPQNGIRVTISQAGLQKQSTETGSVNGDSDILSDPRVLLIELIIEKLTGLKVHHLSGLGQHQSVQAGSSGPGLNIEFSKTHTYSESEQTTMQTSGVIKTTDGKEIQFSMNLNMQRQFSVSETSATQIHLGATPKKTDPLVVNFNGTATQLSDQRFAFDLNSDGNKEQINAPVSGSGFLVLDKNNDGKVNNGSELFGPSSNNGFSELAKYDSDHNNWIDESDSIYSQLKVWTPDANGNGTLSSLASLGIGAISLQAAATPFEIKDASDQLLGSVVSSSVALNNNGTTGSVQEVDLTV
ncbi:VCBS repeat-containing protein [Candidatus Methylospira mobilis]|uniref:VCBS repeat-containing protein n=1 Tax=Candidatus Methylospira mobilis TaxID=1808979 RepID=A0A5Q0BJY3_9GAMM|nr:VCBS repeat-containing protein [Candidatus Methylospira mobilis]QFY42494.1 VCBS repeat-containing protein [Candidatus Methylospira mobilis]